jgi:archaellum biogenesis ATPase FlaH
MNRHTNTAASGTPIEPFNFTSVQDMYDAPPERVSYCVEGLLPSCGLSVLAGKPKAGKSCLTRQLAVAVAQGSTFLGRKTEQGAVFFLALEEKQSEVVGHFRLLGLQGSDPVEVLCGSVQKQQALARLEENLKSTENAKLVIIDPLFRFVNVKDCNEYVPVSDVLEGLLELARKYEVHILTAHHLKKRETEDVTDGALGSTAIVGGCDTFVSLKADAAGKRTVCTRQRYGRDMEPTQLTWDADSRKLSLGATCEEADRDAAAETGKRVERDMLLYVETRAGCEQQALLNAVSGKRTLKLKVMQRLIDVGFLVESGAGVKGDPYTYKRIE